MPILSNLMKHPCGGCTACCSIEIGDKPCGIPCRHAIPGMGCGIYKVRPVICKDWECPWSVGILPTRPDRLGATIYFFRPDQDYRDGWLDGALIAVVLAPGMIFSEEIQAEVMLAGEWLLERTRERDIPIDVFMHNPVKSTSAVVAAVPTAGGAA